MNRTCRALLPLSALLVAIGLISRASLAQSMPPMSQNPLHWAAAKNDVAALKALLDRSPDQIDSADGDSRTALHYAAANGAADAATLLIKRGANLNVQTHRTDIKAAANVTPLHWAIEYHHPEVARLLIRAHANVNLVRTDGNTTALYQACEQGDGDTIRMLLDAGANAKYVQSGSEWSCLAKLVFTASDLDLFKAMILHGADVEARNNTGNTALVYALWSGKPAVARLLLDSGANLDVRANRIERNGVVVRGESGMTCMGSTAGGGNEECIRLALAYGGDPTAKDDFGRDALQVAMERDLNKNSDAENIMRNAIASIAQGWTPAHFAALYGIPDAFDYLRSHGKAIDGQAKDGVTPLMVACINNKTETAAKLLDLNHQFDRYDVKHETALHKAVRQDNPLLCKLLIAAGADTSLRNNDGETAGGLAHHLGFNDLEAALKTVSVTGASPTLLRKFLANRDAISLREIVKKDRSLVNHRYSKNWTPLHFAAFEGDNASVDALLENGAETEASNENGTTPLMLAVQEGKTDVVKLLLSRKASLNARDKQGWTPLHIAAQENRIEIARELIHAGARKNVKDNKGRTPKDVALMTGHDLLSKSL